jgi:beta-lactam-binding protein with PASTA domain
MAEKTQKKGFFRHWIIRNLLICAILVVAMIVGAIVFLNVVTKHNQELVVPDFSNLTVAEAEALASDAGMRVDVTDSVFVKRMKKGAVRDQNPAPGAKVKEGRRISLTINALNAKKVTMPNLVGLSMRQALAELQSRGLTPGKLIYVEDLATNNVLRQLRGNREIEPGTFVESETVINLVLGLNPDSEASTYVPDLLGKRYMSAVDLIHRQSLNVKTIRFDDTVKDYDDSLNAVVYKHMPDISEEPVALGEDVSLYLTMDPEKVPTRESDKNE